MQAPRLVVLGTGEATKKDELLEKLYTAFDPHTFSENYVAIFFRRKALFKGSKSAT